MHAVKTHKRCDKCNKDSVGSWYIWLEIGSMPKARALETFEKYNSIQEATGSWNFRFKTSMSSLYSS